MKILYHMAVLPPKLPDCEALSQEITALRHHFGGDLLYLNPNQHSPIYIPRLGFGFHKLKQIRALETNLDLHHIYNPDAYPFPILNRLKRPLIYSISSGVSKRRPNLNFFSKLAAIAVSDERSLKRLQGWGLTNVFLVRSGIDTNRFSHAPLPLKSEFRLMLASAPWTQAQFQSKGIDALLEAAKLNPNLRLTFLWRGVLTAEMQKRVRDNNLGQQVEIIDQQVNVNQILAKVHASIALATAPGIIKAYPHSLLDSLAAGKPVLVSRAISMADYVEQIACGKVIEQVTPNDILTAIESVTQDYESLVNSAQQVGQRDFSEQTMIASFQKVYDKTLQRITT